MVLEVLLKLTPNAINKGLKTFEVLLEENFKIRPHNRSGVFVAVFVLSPPNTNEATEE